jgi:hypothetical protein
MAIGNGTGRDRAPARRERLRRRCGIAATLVLLAWATTSTSGAESTAASSKTAPPPVTASQHARQSFRFVARKLSRTLRRRITGVSWHKGCPVSRGRLRYLRIAYHGFDGRVHTGRMIANRSAVRPLKRAFARLYRSRFPIRRMRLVEHYGGSDYRSIEADNTSAFNCRRATGQSRWSQHAYGRAVDVNPIENPYVANGRTTHPASRRYLDRSRHRRGMAYPGGALVRAFNRIGWGWGGTWSNPTDYQHFSANGR